ncbi:MAG: ribonuclease III [Blastocatellia bacterium]
MQLAKLEKSLSYSFKSIGLLKRALTHRSWAHENLPGESENTIRSAENESFEFVGDSVLGLAIAEQLFEKHPTLSEGDLTLMKHRLVSTGTLVKIGEALKLGEIIRIGRGEEKTGGRTKPAIIADALEAIIGAVFLDGGYIAARSLISQIFADEINAVTPKSSLDYKTLLQETLQAGKNPAPTYSLLRTEGPPHDRKFYVEAAWHAGRANGTGGSLKSAEMEAASEALKIIEEKAADSKRKQ